MPGGSRDDFFFFLSTLFPQDSQGIAISDRDDQAKAELLGVAPVRSPRVAHRELKSLHQQQRDSSNSTGEKAGDSGSGAAAR